MGKLKWNAGQIVNDTSDYELAQYPATDKPRYLVDYDFKDMEIAQLNKIIDELGKWLEERLEKLDLIGYDDDIYSGIRHTLNKLQELKEEGK